MQAGRPQTWAVQAPAEALGEHDHPKSELGCDDFVQVEGQGWWIDHRCTAQIL